ncbi:MAG: type VI secretion system contractile sheath small subunit [Desulfobacteraceae bacterium]|nr:type VI secretion system contractile sheath small subunit [Desulfobacteraceae bacterium]
MKKDTSVAPRERVNITYRPATADLQESVELPLKLLVMGDYTGAEDNRSIEEREPVSINKDNFNDVLMAQNIRFKKSVKNKLSDDPTDEINVDIEFNRLKDFSPEAISEKVPELKKLHELRSTLLALKGPLSNVPEFRKKIQQLIKDDSKRDQLMAELGISGKQD